VPIAEHGGNVQAVIGYIYEFADIADLSNIKIFSFVIFPAFAMLSKAWCSVPPVTAGRGYNPVGNSSLQSTLTREKVNERPNRRKKPTARGKDGMNYTCLWAPAGKDVYQSASFDVIADEDGG
jgi:hypothetical protein